MSLSQDFYFWLNLVTLMDAAGQFTPINPDVRGRKRILQRDQTKTGSILICIGRLLWELTPRILPPPFEAITFDVSSWIKPSAIVSLQLLPRLLPQDTNSMHILHRFNWKAFPEQLETMSTNNDVVSFLKRQLNLYFIITYIYKVLRARQFVIAFKCYYAVVSLENSFFR